MSLHTFTIFLCVLEKFTARYNCLIYHLETTQYYYLYVVISEDNILNGLQAVLQIIIKYG